MLNIASSQLELGDASAGRKTLEELLRTEVIAPVLERNGLAMPAEVLINPTGSFEYGGPATDTGLTGRKIIVDSYGGWGRHGGGAFSGKDPTKVDRSACYMARYVAKNIVASGLAGRCEVQLAYAIGVAEPVSVMVNTFGTGKVAEERLVEIVRANFDLTPKGMISTLNLRRPIYRATAAFGHFGRTEDSFTWEATNKAKALKEAAQAQLLLHVVDASNPDFPEQIAQVQGVLAEIGAGDIPQLLIFNKADALPADKAPLLTEDVYDLDGVPTPRLFLSAASCSL